MATPTRELSIVWTTLVVLTCFVLFGSVGAVQAADDAIPWRSGPANLARADRATLAESVADLAKRDGARHVVIQFAKPLKADERVKLREAGVTMLRYLGKNAFFAAFGDQVGKAGEGVDVAAIVGLPYVSAIAGIDRAWKLHPLVEKGDAPQHAIVGTDKHGGDIVALYVVFHADVDLMREATATVSRHEAVVRDRLESIGGMVIELPAANVNALADEDSVQWMEWPLPRMETRNDSCRAISEADTVQAAPYNLDGSGVSVLVYDGGTALDTHPDFGGRLTVRDSSGLDEHPTHVSGTIGGDGSDSGGTYRGMAPGVTIESYGYEDDYTGIFLYSNPGDIEDDYNEAIHTYGVDISNNSIGTNTAPNGFPCEITGDYGVTSQLIDTIVRGDGSNPYFNEPFRVVWANGNERQTTRCGDTYFTTAPPACAKNHITVGALNSDDDSMTSFSSWGPTDDYRIKPDIAGPGCQSDDDYGVTSTSAYGGYSTHCGTSMAAPAVTGLAALLIEDFRVQYPSAGLFRNSMLKAFLAHNAEDVGNTGPDYQTGYGSVRIQQTIDFVRNGGFEEQSIDQGEVYVFLVEVDPGDTELKVTMAWDDVPGTPNVTPALVNDLDLRVYDPSSQRHYPWTLDGGSPADPAVRTQEDHINNIEQVYVASPAPGIWRVEVYGYSVPQGPQPVSLCASPQLVGCSSQGVLSVDGTSYACADTVHVRVIDCDVNTNSGVVETVSVSVSSTSEPGGESVLLTETGVDTADFRGSVDVSAVDSAGVVHVADGDTITATYIDADDGQGGTNITVSSQAGVDCAAPVITNVAATDLLWNRATVAFDTDELAGGSVRFGLSCAALASTAAGTAMATNHAVVLTGLGANTTYAYVVDAVDGAGNAGTNDNGGACYTLTTPDATDYFTEDFVSGWDLENITAVFTPDASADYYHGCAESITSLPVDPSGGTTLSVGDDDYTEVSLSGGETVTLYGTSYSSFFVNSNGSVTFGAGDTTYDESLYAHFATPRISGLFDDLDPTSGGTISVRQLADRIAVTWSSVVEWGESSGNTFQIEMRFDGVIVLSYLSVYADDGIAGLSSGGGSPIDYVASDLSGMGSCDVATCDDGLLNQGEDRIDCGGPCPACACLSDAACDDTDVCNGNESCDAYGVCQAGTPLTCDDADDCTTDSCVSPTGCVFDPIDCSDGLLCTEDICTGGVCSNPPVDCQGRLCDPVDGVCKDCLVDGDCPGLLPYCDPVDNTCKQCLDPSDCEDGLLCTYHECTFGVCSNHLVTCPGEQVCDPADGVCKDCVDHGDCAAPTPYCDPAEHVCRACLDAGHCDDALLCTEDFCTDGVCGNPPVDCPGQVCDPADGVCKDCVEHGDCPVQLPFCDPADNTCKQCLVAADCEDGMLCTYHACTAGVCSSHPVDCPGAQLCDPLDGVCKDCLDHSDCDAPTPYCDSADGTCHACLNAGHCDDGLLCTDDACDGGVCLNPAVVCPGEEVCDPADGVCKECVDHGDCGAPTPYCDSADNSCKACLDAGHCDDALLCTDDACTDGVCVNSIVVCPGAQLCDPSDGVCKDCLEHGDCDGATPWCDPADNTCKACLTGSHCDDGLLCTFDTCTDGVCANPAVVCSGAQLCDPNDGVCKDCLEHGDCDGVMPWCDPADNTCKACLAGSHCDDGLLCTFDTCTDGVCENPAVVCSGAQLCDPSDGVCKDCLEHADCDGATPWCNPGDDTCRECLEPSHCVDDGLWCNGSETCIDFACGHEDPPCEVGEMCVEAEQLCLPDIPCSGHVDCVLANNNCCEWDSCGGLVSGYCDPVIPMMFGDVTGTMPGTVPNGAVNLTDVVCVLDAFGVGNLENCANADVAIDGVEDCPGGNGVVNLSDILKVLDAFGAPSAPGATLMCDCPMNP